MVVVTDKSSPRLLRASFVDIYAWGRLILVLIDSKAFLRAYLQRTRHCTIHDTLNTIHYTVLYSTVGCFRGAIVYSRPTFSHFHAGNPPFISWVSFAWVLDSVRDDVLLQVALEYILRGPSVSGAQVTAEVKRKLSDEHVKVGNQVSYTTPRL